MLCRYFVFFFKQKTAYEMRISDWSSDVCSSDLQANRYVGAAEQVIDMKLSLPQQLLGAFALADVLSMGVVAPAAARDNDNQRSEPAHKATTPHKATAQDTQAASPTHPTPQPAPRRPGRTTTATEPSQPPQKPHHQQQAPS